MTVDFKNVRDDFALSGFFENLMGATAKNVSGNLRYSACPSCGPSSDASVKCSVRNNRWHCFSCEKRGDVIDAAASFFGLPPAQAAMQLVGNTGTQAPKRSEAVMQVVEERNQDAINEVILLLLQSQRRPDKDCVDYLESRGIDKDVVSEAVFRQLIITMPGDPNKALRHLLDVVGRDLLIQSGIWKQGSKAPAACYRPLAFINSDKRGIEFRLIAESPVALAKTIRYGEPGPWIWSQSQTGFMIVEGGVDLLSAIAMGTARTVIGLPGAKNWSVTDAWLQTVNGHVHLALDNDRAGSAGAKAFEDYFKGKTVTRRHEHLAGCKDLNDQLRKGRGIM